MHKGTIDFLSNFWQTGNFYFQESWQIGAPPPEEAMKRLHRIAQARRLFFAKNFRVVRLKMPKTPTQRPLWRGTKCDFAFPSDGVLLRPESGPTRRLRGVSQELLSGHGLTAALANFNKTLR